MLLNESNGAPSASAATVETTTRTFAKDVLQESRTQPVLVDFWAPWCGPCKQLEPMLEKVVKAAQGKIKLVKLNIDEHQAIPNQLGIQSIPTVIAFKNGQPVDGFMGAVPERQIQAFVERLVGPVGAGEHEIQLEDADAALATGQEAEAATLYSQVLAADAGNVHAIAGLARAQAAMGNIEGARGILDTIPADKANDPHAVAARAQIDLAEQTAKLGATGELEAAIAADPDNNHQARHDFALALAARGERQQAVDHLIHIVRADRAWNDDGARKQLVHFFEAWGPTDPATLSGRRQLSSILFA